MTPGSGAHQDRADLFVADFYPQFGEYLAEQHATGYDAGSARARFQAWLGEHAEAPAAADPVRDYLKQISKIPGLSAEQEAELARQIEAGRQAEAQLAAAGDGSLAPGERIDLEWLAEVGTRARNHLLEANLRLVVSLAKRYTGRGMLVPGPDPGGQPGPDPGDRALRLHQGRQVLRLRHLVDPAGDHPGAGREAR